MSILIHKFGEKELQETGMYDYGWRNYMPDIGRWNGADPLSEKYAYQSHYNFSENRVVDGRELEGIEVDVINEDGSHDTDYSMDNWGGLAYDEVSLS